ncbi:MAG TPA: sigma-54 dependent transcriptional regulator [bacterium]|nr:sigma-54 dependent transcriptional regulator [bacterium]
MARILVIDDEERIGLLLSETLRDLGHEASYLTDGRVALERLRPGAYDLVITDLRMEPVPGMEIVRAVAALPGTDVAVLTAHGTTGAAVAAMKAGALDFLSKPLDLDEMTQWVEHWDRGRGDRATSELRVAPPLAAARAETLVGDSAPMREMRRLIELVAPRDATVLILGESGTGKELVARALHDASPRANGQFVATNCAALTETLLESELFGHEKGAFTGAYKQRIGRFELADKGTLFLDEIGEVSPGFQSKLLRALEQREIVRVGSATPIKVDARVIVATNKDLARQVAEGRFREDLYFRLNVFPIHVPPLRERLDDIEALALHFLRLQGYQKPRLARAVVDRLRQHSWPGNVRELKNVIERAVILANGGPLAVEHLGPLTSPRVHHDPSLAMPAEHGLEDVEKRLVEEALKASGGNKSEAARRLKITRRVLYAKLRRYGLE